MGKTRRLWNRLSTATVLATLGSLLAAAAAAAGTGPGPWPK